MNRCNNWMKKSPISLIVFFVCLFCFLGHSFQHGLSVWESCFKLLWSLLRTFLFVVVVVFSEKVCLPLCLQLSFSLSVSTLSVSSLCMFMECCFIAVLLECCFFTEHVSWKFYHLFLKRISLWMLCFVYPPTPFAHQELGGSTLESLCPSVLLAVCPILSGKYLLNHSTVFLVRYYHEMECDGRKIICYLHGQSHSEGL